MFQIASFVKHRIKILKKLLGLIKELKNMEKLGEFVLAAKVLKKFLHYAHERKLIRDSKLKMY